MVSVTRPLLDYYWKFRTERRAKQIARHIVPDLWGATRRKMSTSAGSAKELRAYAEGRAAQLAQPLVDDFLRANERVPPVQGNRMIVLAAARAASLVAQMADEAASRHGPVKR